MKYGVIEFIPPEQCEIRQFVRSMEVKAFELDDNVLAVEKQEVDL